MFRHRKRSLCLLSVSCFGGGVGVSCGVVGGGTTVNEVVGGGAVGEVVGGGISVDTVVSHSVMVLLVLMWSVLVL